MSLRVNHQIKSMNDVLYFLMKEVIMETYEFEDLLKVVEGINGDNIQNRTDSD